MIKARIRTFKKWGKPIFAKYFKVLYRNGNNVIYRVQCSSQNLEPIKNCLKKNEKTLI